MMIFVQRNSLSRWLLRVTRESVDTIGGHRNKLFDLSHRDRRETWWTLVEDIPALNHHSPTSPSSQSEIVFIVMQNVAYKVCCALCISC